MLEKFRTYIDREKLFQNGERILLAVSGGVDSIVMSELFYQAGISFGMAHCNFGLRGSESEEDQTFVSEISTRYGVPFFSKKFETAEWADVKNISIQMAARELRYEWLEEIRRSHNYDYIAIGSHKNDDLETFLINFTRGTGIAGLRGMLPKSGKVIRPMLFATREEIEVFAKEEKLKFREDSSNASDKYLRNRIRKTIIPVLKEINPSIEETTAENLRRLKETEEVYLQRVEEVRGSVCVKEGDKIIILKKNLQNLNPLKTYLFELLKPFNFNQETVENIMLSINGQSGKRFFSPTHCVYIEREELVIVPNLNLTTEEVFISENGSESSLGLTLKFKSVDNKNFDIRKEPRFACLDAGKLQFPLTLRKWKQGDYFYPLGMKKKKKLSNFLIDTKVPLYKKEHIFVLTSQENQIAWVIGHRIDERFKIDDSTEKVYLVELIANDNE